MRRTFLVVLLLLSLRFSNCQPVLDFNAGINYPVIPYTDFYDHADVDKKVSYSFGSDFTARVYKNLYYSLGISYNKFEAHVLGSESSPSHLRAEDIDLTLGYVSLSAMPEYSFGKKRILFIRAGGYFSLLLNSREVGTYDTRVVNGDHHHGEINHDASADYEDIDFGLSANAGIRLKISYNAWLVPQIKYNSGLYKYNLIGSNIQDVERGAFKSVLILLGVDIELGHPGK